MKYIEYKNAEIRWDENKFYVYEATDQDLEKYHSKKAWEESHIDRYRNLSFSHGRCFTWWADVTKDERLFIAFQLILECEGKDKLKNVLFQLGKIDEFESIRLLFYNQFPDLLPQHTFEQFKNGMYPDDMDYKWM